MGCVLKSCQHSTSTGLLLEPTGPGCQSVASVLTLVDLTSGQKWFMSSLAEKWDAQEQIYPEPQELSYHWKWEERDDSFTKPLVGIWKRFCRSSHVMLLHKLMSSLSRFGLAVREQMQLRCCGRSHLLITFPAQL